MTIVVSRGNFRFSASGRFVGCEATDDAGARHVEVWQSTSAGPRLRWRVADPAESSMTQLVALDDGRLVQSWNTPPRSQTTVLLDAVQGSTGRWESDVPMRLLAVPAGLAVAVTVEADGSSTIHALSASGTWRRPVARVPGVTGGAATTAGRLHVTVLDRGTPRLSTVDLATGAVSALHPACGTGHVLVAAADRVLVAEPTDTGHRLALVPAAGTGTVEYLDGPTSGAGPLAPVALDPTGTVLAATVGRGARSGLLLFDTRTGTQRPVDVPDGVLAPLAAWPSHGLWLPHSTPTQPMTMAWVPPGSAALHAGVTHDRAGTWRPGRLETFTGPAGPIEAVVYGPDWRRARTVVVALHGGPDSHWTFGFDRLMQVFADAGLALVAPNQRGSTGYGSAHATAIAGAWGGPDLADIQALGAHIRAARPALARHPVLYGISYGAYLALLTAAVDAGNWAGCAAIAPFRSGAALYDDATAAVRDLIDRLGGRRELRDRLGHRDLARLAHLIDTRLLIIHGEHDEIVPVTESRRLVDRLAEVGHRDVTYREAPGRFHNPLGVRPDDPLTAELVRFLGADETCERDPQPGRPAVPART